MAVRSQRVFSLRFGVEIGILLNAGEKMSLVNFERVPLCAGVELRIVGGPRQAL